MNRPTITGSRELDKGSAWKFIILVGLVSLFSDMTYEGARSISGPFLGSLGAGAVVVGVVAGAGEFLGYALRLASGYAADRSGKYWPLTIGGYAVNLLAVPLLALVGSWPSAAGLLVTERLGKGIRTPARDAMLSHAVTQVGRGWGFGFHNAMDQVGAVTGPLIVAAVLSLGGGYRLGFGVLLVPTLVALGVLGYAARRVPSPQHLEINTPDLAPAGLSRSFWLYTLAAGGLAAGYADFPLIAYHWQQAAILRPDWIPIYYAVAMAVDALAALALGRWFDRAGMKVVVAAPLLSAFFAPLVFWGGSRSALSGMILWGLGMGAQGSVVRAALAAITPRDRRASAFGIFYTGFGLCWFLGSALMGILYTYSLPALVTFSVAMQLAAIPLFAAALRDTGLRLGMA